MKRLLQITALIIIWLIAGAPGCGEDRRNEIAEQQVSVMSDSLKHTLGRDYLPPEAVESFTLSAIQKVRDLADFWNIIADPSADTAFKIQAARMVKSLFRDETVLITMPGITKTSQSLSDWIHGALSGKMQVSGFSIDTVIVGKPLARITDSLYEGVLHIVVREVSSAGSPEQRNIYRCNMIAEKSPVLMNGKHEYIWRAWLQDVLPR